MKKSRIVLFLATGMMLFLLTGGAWAYDFNDVTLVEKWQSGAVINPSIDPTPWTGVIGVSSYFNTMGADLSGDILTIYTNWNPRKDGHVNDTNPTIFPNLFTADLFIDEDLDGSFDYAIGLDYNSNYINNIGNVYINPVYQTSHYFWSTSGHIYGGKYNQASPSDVPVHATGTPDPLLSPISVAWTLGSGGLNNQVKIDLSSLNLDSNWSFVWGTATCGNDTITGKVPEPTSMLLLGLGLLGVAVVRRKFSR